MSAFFDTHHLIFCTKWSGGTAGCLFITKYNTAAGNLSITVFNITRWFSLTTFNVIQLNGYHFNTTFNIGHVGICQQNQVFTFNYSAMNLRYFYCVSSSTSMSNTAFNIIWLNAWDLQHYNYSFLFYNYSMDVKRENQQLLPPKHADHPQYVPISPSLQHVHTHATSGGDGDEVGLTYVTPNHCIVTTSPPTINLPIRVSPSNSTNAMQEVCVYIRNFCLDMFDA